MSHYKPSELFSVGTVLVSALSVASTYLCFKYSIYADFPMTLVGTAVIFPIVFSINGAYKRREVALSKYAAMKALGKSIFLATRDWLPEKDISSLDNVKKILGDLLNNSSQLFNSNVAAGNPFEEKIYQNFSDLSLHIKSFRKLGLATGEVSRCNQYMSKMLQAFEDAKHIYQYRTPRSLRLYSKIFLYSLPVIYGPFFADITKSSNIYLLPLMPTLFSIVFISLDNIQEHLENPFDQVGTDDVKINADKFVSRLA